MLNNIKSIKHRYCLKYEPEIKTSKSNLIDIETKLFKDIELVYDVILSWTQKNKLKIKKLIRPYLIEAKHGSSFTFSRKPEKWTKNFTFLLNEVEEITIIRMIVNPPWHDRYQSNANETARSWLEFTATLWEELEINTQNIYPQEIYNPETIVNELNTLWRNIYLGIIIGTIIFSYGLVNSLFRLPDLEILEFVGIMGFLSAMMSYFGVGPTKKRISLLGIDTSIYTDKFRPLKFFTIFVVLGSLASIYWVWNLDPYITYSDFGFSFTRNRYWDLEATGVIAQEPDDQQGQLSLKTEEANFGMSWISMEYARDDFTKVGVLDSMILLLIENLDEANIDYVHNVWKRGILNVNGHEMVFQNGSITMSDEMLYYVYGVFFCDESDRLFTFAYIVDRDFHLTYFGVMLEDFKCH